MNDIAENEDNDGQRDAQPAAGPLSIRITNHGKMKGWISFAMKFFENNADRPFILHTLPSTPSSNESVPAEIVPTPKPGSLAPSKTSSTAATTIPRLISVVEIIKREYLKALETNRSTKLSGLHQYNEIGCLEDLGLNSGEEETRSIALEKALEGKNHLKQKQTPFMRVTLCQRALPELVERGATYQPPVIRKVSKSARARAKKREKKAMGTNEKSVTQANIQSNDKDDCIAPQ